jgi:hypothetical protein
MKPLSDKAILKVSLSLTIVSFVLFACGLHFDDFERIVVQILAPVIVPLMINEMVGITDEGDY